MAQVKRLNLRMQREIKLLQDDPPHGVSLNENGLSSLSSIEARIEGPEGTVYAKGVFILKIQIPERYPFQPPNVTFVTPIYHPNIDNGGRICLDILNLPPKGAWQPSLNIATVLTSIGLLLSEPNPDDGLMAEISREYKYNRQVFDINAQVWTEKYASPAAVGAIGWGSVDAGVLNTQVEDTESQGSLPKSSKKHCEGNQTKMRLLGQKLSLKSGRSEEDMKTVKQDPVASHLPAMAGSTYPTACFSDVSGGQNDTSEKMFVGTASGVVSKIEYQGNNKNPQLPSQELSVTSEAPSKTSGGTDVFAIPNHSPTSASHAYDHGMQSFDDILENSFPRRIGGSSDSSYQPPEGNRRNIRTLGLKLSLKSVKPEKKSDDQKENMAPNHLPPQLGFNKLQKRPLDAVSRKQFSGGPALVQQNPITEHQQSNTQVVSTEECNQGRKKLCSLSRRLLLKSQQSGLDSACDKDYKPPNCSLRENKRSELPLSALPALIPKGEAVAANELPLSATPAPIPKGEAVAPNELPLSATPAPIPKGEAVAPNELPLSVPTVLESQAKALGFAGPQRDANSGNSSVKQNAVSIENVVVSDSEDSEDERERPPKSRLSLMRRRLAGKPRT